MSKLLRSVTTLAGPVCALLVAAGCGAATPAAAPGAAPAAPDASAPVTPKVNRIVLATTAPAQESLEPRQLAGATSPQVRPMYEHLVGMDAKGGKFVPQLATEWSGSADGKSWTFKLRKGVQFHQGYGEFPAKDLPQLINEYIRADSVGGWAPYWKEYADSVEVVNDYEVVYHIKKTDGQFLQDVIEERAGNSVWSKKHFDAVGPNGLPYAGTGPYQFKERQQAVSIRFERVPYKHWRNTPDFPEFEFRWMKEASTRLAALIAGEVQITDIPDDLQPQAVAKGMKVIPGQYPGLRVFISMYCCFHQDIKDRAKGWIDTPSPLKDVKVRKALSKAINRAEMNKAFFNNKGLSMVLSHFHATRPGWNPDWEKRFPDEYGYDPAKAKQMLAEAGYGPGNPAGINLVIEPVAGIPVGQDMTESIASYFRAVGVNINLLAIDPTEKANGTRALRLTNHMNILTTGTTQWGSAYAYMGGITSRGSKVEIAPLDDLLDQLQLTADPQKQEELWRKAGDIYYANAGSIPLFWLPVEAVVNASIISQWVYPGGISGAWSHVDNIKAAR